jgi:tetratricopeptide (TPR) repeat protein
MSLAKASATLAGTLSFVALLILAFIVVSQTNLKVIQADIVYKRADPWDKQAARSNDPALWDNAIAIYEHAIELAPREDFYYLWLGRAYLERSSVTEDTAEQAALLRTAEERLIEAQKINPLNTDHTANLARLNTRWAEIADEQDRQERIDIASGYYEAAMSLSPNNAIIINEYARLAFVLDQDCERAEELFERSTERDPYFTNTLFEQYEVLRVCGDRQEDDADRKRYYALAAESLAEGLERQTRPAQDWLQLAGLYIVLDRVDEALAAYDMASELRDDDLEQWRIEYTMADWFFQEGQFEEAEEFGLKALAGAPDDVAAQIQQFIDGIAAARGEVDG